MGEPSDKRARLQAVIGGAKPDRPPVSFWRHWPESDQSGEALARATVAFQERFDFDFVKLSPASNYAVAGWGGRSEYRQSLIGTRDWLERVVHEPEDWAKLQPLDPRAGLQGELLRAIELVRKHFGAGVPLIPTVFNPLAMAKYLAGEETLALHLREHQDALLAGLRTLEISMMRFVEEAVRRGIDGIFLAVQHATGGFMDEATYRRFGEPGDRQLLSVAGDCWLNVLHLHGDDPMFELGSEYPVAAINWHAEETIPSMTEASKMTSKALCGGMGTSFPMVNGSADDVSRAVDLVCEEVDSARLILSSGCVLPLATPEANLERVAQRLITQPDVAREPIPDHLGFGN